MSRNSSYRDAFDNKAGKPADFDSLFSFRDGELITKKRIKMDGRHRRSALAVPAAAVFTAAAILGFAYLSRAADTSEISIDELADLQNETTAVSEYIDNKDTVFKLSEITKFDYSLLADAYTGDYDDYTLFGDITGADMIASARILSKSMDENGIDAVITYEMGIGSYYVDQNKTPEETAIAETVTVKSFSGLHTGAAELQIGCEYIVPICINDDGSYTISGLPIRKTPYGWLMCAQNNPLVKESALPVENDVSGLYDVLGELCIEPSDDVIFDNIKQILEDSEKKYYHFIKEDDYVNRVIRINGFSFEPYTDHFGNISDTEITVNTSDSDVLFHAPGSSLIYGGKSISGESLYIIDISKSNDYGYLFGVYGDSYGKTGNAESSYASYVMILGGTADTDLLDSDEINIQVGSANVKFLDENGIPMVPVNNDSE